MCLFYETLRELAGGIPAFGVRILKTPSTTASLHLCGLCRRRAPKKKRRTRKDPPFSLFKLAGPPLVRPVLQSGLSESGLCLLLILRLGFAAVGQVLGIEHNRLMLGAQAVEVDELFGLAEHAGKLIARAFQS